jgi:membrane-bound ClpP family serine protease
MKRRIPGILAGLLLAVAFGAPTAYAGHVNVVTISGSINPASSDYIQHAIEQSESEGAAALLI